MKPKTTGERLILIEEQMEQNAREHGLIIAGQKSLEEKIDTNQQTLEGKLDAFMKSADNKYAQKWVQNAVYGGLISLATALLGLIIYLIQSHFKF